MNYKYNITYIENSKKQKINFKKKIAMILYLEKKKKELGKYNQVKVNFGAVSLPLKDTIWKV
jgi:hypothetical protein